VTLPLWDDPDPPPQPAPRRWKPVCHNCGRRIWAAAALRPRYDGGLYGDKCARARARAQRRLRLTVRLRPPGDVPGQLTLDEAT
jgi:hypothetical protein